MRFAARGEVGSSSLAQAYPLILSAKPPYLWLPSELKAALPWLTSVSVTFISRWADSSPTLAHSFPITFLQKQSRALPRLSPVTSILSPSFVSLSSALIHILSKSPGLVLWNLSYRKLRTHKLQAARGRLAPGQGLSGNNNTRKKNLQCVFQ